MNPWATWLATYGTARYQLSRKQGWHAFVTAPPREPFEVLSRPAMSRLSEEELEDYNEARMVWNANLPTIKTSQLAAAYGICDQVMASAYRDGDKLRGSVVIDAEPGLGKTTIATRYARDVHRRVLRRDGPLTAEGHQRWPVAFIPLSAGVTLKGLNQQILRFYGHPAVDRASTSKLGALAVDCVTSCGTRLIVLDDLHFVDFRHHNGLEVSNHLKGLANDMAATFIYVGVNLTAKRFFDEGLFGEHAVYAQTSRRATRCPVAPFGIDTDTGMRGWLALLRTAEEHLVLADARAGMLCEHARLLHRRTQGRIASLTNLLDRVSYLAIVTGVEAVTAELIATATVDNASESAARTG
ncbi:ATP-binding protein [Rhodococcus sp. 105337]|uniref:ATP-binding protein n=1 Tax=Rhodococcus sp. 105337 TaxID=2725310 RepID=UPI00146CFB94|nr:ATP-binding protein [Rhodococcus sp. 105337]NME81497.1 AAA family ATPase [Rhodococcus sp. 105337]